MVWCYICFAQFGFVAASHGNMSEEYRLSFKAFTSKRGEIESKCIAAMQARKEKWTPKAISKGCLFLYRNLETALAMRRPAGVVPASVADKLLSQDFYAAVISVDKELTAADSTISIFGQSGGLFDE